MLENLRVLRGGSAKAHLPRFFFMLLGTCSCIWLTFVQVFGVFSFMYLAEFCSDDWRIFIPMFGELNAS